jgi:hypothetical protein
MARRKDYLSEVSRNTGWLYLIRPSGHYFTEINKTIPFKIGFTFHSPETRLRSLQSANFMPLQIDSQYGVLLEVRDRERTVLNFIKQNTKAKQCAGKEWFLLTKSQYRKVRKLMSNIEEHWCIPNW